MATIRDVARTAGVSIATVSRVINGDGSVHPTLRRLVEDAVQHTGYRPNAAARSLRRARTGTIGVVVPELRNPALTAIVQGIEQVAREREVSLFLCDAGGSFRAQGRHLERLHERRVDGVIIYPIGRFREQIAPLREAGIPVVVVGQRVQAGDLPGLVADEYDASRAAFRLLLDLGHRRIGFIVRGSVTSLPETDVMGNRIAAYRAAHAEAGVPLNEALIVAARTSRETFGRAEALLSGPNPVTALVSGMHTDAPEVLAAIQAAGLCVPDDVSVISYGDSRWAEVFHPPLTVVRTDYDESGRRIADLLFAAARGEATPQTIHQQSELVIRGSCAPPRGRPG
jgi:LacI family transcriptional regulator